MHENLRELTLKKNKTWLCVKTVFEIEYIITYSNWGDLKIMFSLDP